jgi:hypothetical protein
MNNKIAVALASTAIVASIIYLAFTAIALAYYPQTYSPLTNWLSDLGNPTVNPSGALYYDAGGVVTSVALIFFFTTSMQPKTVAEQKTQPPAQSIGRRRIRAAFSSSNTRKTEKTQILNLLKKGGYGFRKQLTSCLMQV